MHIFYDHQIFTLQMYGGISRYFYELISRMRLRVEVSVYMGFYVNMYGLESYKNDYSNFYGLRRSFIPGVFNRNRLVYWVDKIALYSYTKRNNADIYHPTYYGSYLPDFKGPRIVTVFDMIHELFLSENPLERKEIEKKKKAIIDADGILCISSSTKDDLQKIYNIPDNKIKVVYLASSINRSINATPIITSPYILYVGARGGYKNFHRLFEVYLSNNDIKDTYTLVCFGGGPFTQNEVLTIRKNNLENRVIQIGGTDESLANLYSFAKVFVYPSLYEGFGLPPLEAMNQGCPVLASNQSSIPEVVGNAGLYFDPNSIEDLACKLKKILNDSSLRQNLIISGYERFKSFSWDKCVDETILFYKQILQA